MMGQIYVKCLKQFANVTVGKVCKAVKVGHGFVRIVNDLGCEGVWYLKPGEFELVSEGEMKGDKEIIKSPREMEFSSKLGSAVVHYKSGQTFHITQLTYMAVLGGKVLVTREYQKDGLDFTQSVYIPFEKFDCVVIKTKTDPLIITLSEDNLLRYSQEVKKPQLYFN